MNAELERALLRLTASQFWIRRLATGALSESGVFRLALPLLVALALPGLPVLAEVILFDNLAVGSPNGSFGVSNTQWTAQSFATTSAGFILDEVSIRLWNLNGTSGNFKIQVWDALGTGGRPGAQVGAAVYTGLAQNLGSSYGSLLAVSGLNLTLAPDTNYYLVAAGTSLTDIPDDEFPRPGTLYWDATNVVTSPAYDTSNSGANWNGPFVQNLYMKVNAVPEPSTYCMALAGLGFMGSTMWRLSSLSSRSRSGWRRRESVRPPSRTRALGRPAPWRASTADSATSCSAASCF